MKILLELFIAFARVGVMTFGGGYAMLPIIEREIVDKRHWAELDEIMDYYAVGQCTPGVIAVNTATFIGGCFIFFMDTVKSGATAEGMSVWGYLIIFFVGLNFVFELLLNIILSPAILRIIDIGKKIRTKR